MAKVLTTGSTVQCIHQFGITFTSTATLRVGGKAVVRSSDLAGATISCAASQQKCTAITGSAPSVLLQDGGSPVVLITGLGTDRGTCTVNANHDLLETD